jgi:hypothetical protein
MSGPTIEWFDAAQIHLPAEVLAIDLSHISHIERILFAGMAGSDVDVRSLLLQDVKDDAAGRLAGIDQSILAMFMVMRINLAPDIMLRDI